MHRRIVTATGLARSVAALGVLAAVGCRDTSPPSTGETDATGSTGSDLDTTDGTGAVDSTGTPASVTFWGDVAPLFYERCVSCHQPEGVAPFRLDTYEEAMAWGPAAAAAVAERSMPPWSLNADGSCGTFVDPQWLTDEEIALVAAWVDEGLAEGEPQSLEVPAVSSLDESLELRTPDFVPEIQGGDLAQFDEYRCFLIDVDVPKDGFITGFDGQPGNVRLIHHMVAMPIDVDLLVTADGRTNGDIIQELSDESPEREGWECFSRAGEGVVPSGVPITWTPGKGVVEFPEGTGIRVYQGDQFVVQVHYNLASQDLIGISDSSAIGVRIEDEVEREAFMFPIDPLLDSMFDDEPTTLEPGQPSVQYTWEMTFGGVLGPLPSVDLFGIFPHMHGYGRKFDMAVHQDDGSVDCGAQMDRWDFDWQQLYFYADPITITADSRMEVTCDYDTTAATDPVLPGWGTTNEMCLADLYVVLPPGIPLPPPTDAPQIPGWTCDPYYWDSDDGCDCGCGVFDPDCVVMTSDVCEYCDNEGSCGMSCDEIDPLDNSTCV